jgi:hypothetical protein
MAKADREPVVLYRVWRPDYGETEQTAANFGCLDERAAATYFAGVCHRHRDGWEWTWPQTFRVKNLATGKTFDIEVERHLVPEFEACKVVEVSDG